MGSMLCAAAPNEDPARHVTFEELDAAGFEVPFHFTGKIKLTYSLLQQAKAEIAAQRRINELLAGVHNRASADAAAAEIAQQRAVFSVGAAADVVALFVLECYPNAVNMVYAYEDLKLKLKSEDCYGSTALQALLQ